jgi:hypothetical protein
VQLNLKPTSSKEAPCARHVLLSDDNVFATWARQLAGLPMHFQGVSKSAQVRYNSNLSLQGHEKILKQGPTRGLGWVPARDCDRVDIYVRVRVVPVKLFRSQHNQERPFHFSGETSFLVPSRNATGTKFVPLFCVQCWNEKRSANSKETQDALLLMCIFEVRNIVQWGMHKKFSSGFGLRWLVNLLSKIWRFWILDLLTPEEDEEQGLERIRVHTWNGSSRLYFPFLFLFIITDQGVKVPDLL